MWLTLQYCTLLGNESWKTLLWFDASVLGRNVKNLKLQAFDGSDDKYPELSLVENENSLIFSAERVKAQWKVDERYTQ